jgi:sterol desaturase/sphingolipid hydroxylase (fatty acid hydroxylase superfamily)
MKAIGAFLLGFVTASFLEYVVHRLMHAGVLFARRHALHHRDGWGQGFWPELGCYLLPALPVIMLPWLLGPGIGAGWALGCLAFAVFVAYAHQLQHDNPAACRWMDVPVHYVHHRDRMWRHNFGMAFDVWDRLLGTYRAAAPPGEEAPRLGKGGPFDIHWRHVSEGPRPERTRSMPAPAPRA